MRPMNTSPPSRGGGISTASSPSRISLSRTIPDHYPSRHLPASSTSSPRTTPASASDAEVSQHETGAAGAPDAVAQVVGRGPRVSANPDLVECVAAPVVHHRTQQARILIADDGAQPLDRARIHRQRLVAAEAGGKLNTPRPSLGKLHMLFQLGDKRIR